MTDRQIEDRFEPRQAATLGQALSAAVSLVVTVANCGHLDAIRFVQLTLGRIAHNEVDRIVNKEN